MDFISNKRQQIQQMLEVLGVGDIRQLFSAIPSQLLCEAPQDDDGISEMEGMRHMEALATKNTFPQHDCYLGAGAYEHHVPALASAICQRSEFLTAYTPYQAEVSQGLLQAIFEFQSALCALTGLDVANASVYDGGSACAEAVLMALRHCKKRQKVVISSGLHPHYRQIVDQYLQQFVRQEDVVVETVEDLSEYAFDDNTAAILMQAPDVMGVVRDYSAVTAAAREAGAVSILCANPLAYGLFRSAADQGADIAVGDTQPLGVPLQFGGPYVGYMVCRQELVRQMPGRIVGETVDVEGRRGFVLTLQAREQHIRREKATSNICSNQNLAALSSLVTMLWYGPEGLRKLAITNYQRAQYLREGLLKIKGVAPVSSGNHFNEFAIRLPIATQDALQAFYERGIAAGVDLFALNGMEGLLIAVTETKSREQLDRYLTVAQEVLT